MWAVIKKFGGVALKAKSALSNGESIVQQGLGLVKSYLTSKLLIFAIPIVIIGIVLLVFVSIFSKNMYQMQMNDIQADSSNRSTGTGVAGNVNYSEADFEDAVETSYSVAIAGDFSEFASHLSGTKYNNIEGFNSSMKANVEKAGWGTRAGVVAAAMTLGYEYPKATGYKLFYQYPNDTRTGHEGVSEETVLDCRAFVQWAVYNGGFKAEELSYITGMPDIGVPMDDVTKVKPGDIFATPGVGHIWLVVGTYDGGYYAAEEFGNSNGLVINKYSFDNAYGNYPGAILYDMSNYYNDSSNVRSK